MFKTLLGDNTSHEHFNAVIWLLKPLEADWGEIVKQVIAQLRNGSQITQAGESLAAGLRAWHEAILQERDASRSRLAEENAHLYQECSDLRREISELRGTIQSLEEDLEKLGEHNNEQERSLQQMQFHIASQNEVLAEQYYKLTNIFGHSNNSTTA